MVGRPRAFDWDEAAKLYAETRNYSEVARRLGVREQSVRSALRPDLRIEKSEHQRERKAWVGTCKDCGAPATKTFNYAERNGRCRDCHARRQTTSVRPDTLRCHRCLLWLPDASFSSKSANTLRRGRDHECKPCARVRRRDDKAALRARGTS